MRLIISLVLCVLLFSSNCIAQSPFHNFLKPSDTLHKKRRNLVVATEASLASIALLGLNQIWYADYERSKFHTINDNNEWLQMDKLGHVFSAYQVGKYGAQVLNWSGVSKRDQLIYGATLGFSFLTAVEMLDGYSKEWGFSWGDIGANALGSGLYISQELLWKEQRIDLKFSFHQTQYAVQSPDKLGKSFLEEVLKDYNGQTYWLSVNLHSFFKESIFPKWLNLAFGYGGEGMLKGVESIENISGLKRNRYRQYYLSLDVNLTKIDTKSPLLKSVFNVFNMIKIPFPALEFNKNKPAFHLFFI